MATHTSPEPDEDITSLDGDSAFECSDSDQSDTTSVASSIKNYRKENGRTYHAYEKAQYYYPNDEEAQDHMDISHHFYTLLHGGKLLHKPVGNVNRVLDLGTGTGIWAMDFADENPGSDVKGIDISPIQPVFVPPNCRFEVDDYNEEFLDDDKFELIHVRGVDASVLDGRLFYQRIWNALAPGGHLRGSEWDLDDYYSGSHADQKIMDIFDKSHPLYGHMKIFMEASESRGVVGNMGPRVEGWLKDAGFINITVEKVKVPFGRWPKDKKQREIGAWNALRLTTGLPGWMMRLGTSVLGLSTEEVKASIARVQEAYQDRSLQLWMYIYLYAAEKPLEPSSPNEAGV